MVQMPPSSTALTLPSPRAYGNVLLLRSRRGHISVPAVSCLRQRWSTNCKKHMIRWTVVSSETSLRVSCSSWSIASALLNESLYSDPEGLVGEEESIGLVDLIGEGDWADGKVLAGEEPFAGGDEHGTTSIVLTKPGLTKGVRWRWG